MLSVFCIKLSYINIFFFSSLSNDDSGEEGPSKQKKVKYAQKFKSSWQGEVQFKNWVTPGKDDVHAKCRICSKQISVKTTGRLALVRHQDSAVHQKLAKSVKQQSKLTEMAGLKSWTNQQTAVKNADLHIAAFISEHNLPYNLMEHFPDLLRKLCPDSDIAKQIHCSRTKCSCIVKNVLGKKNKEEICEILKVNKFSLIIDESTDRACTKHLCLMVRYRFNQK